MSELREVKHKISTDETGNSTKVLLTGGATFEGTWEDVTKYTTVAVAIKGDNVTDGTLYIESSQDGGSVVNSVPFAVADASFDLPHLWNVVESHIRIRYTNGTTAQTGHFQLQTKYSNGQELGLLQNAGDSINANTDVQITKSVLTGEVVDDSLNPTGTYENVRITSDDALVTALPPHILFQKKRPVDPALPSGSSVTIDPVLNVESNVLDSGWLPVNAFGGGSLINIVSDVNLDAYIMNASSISGNSLIGDDAPTLTALANTPATVGAAFFDDYFRMLVVNTSGTTADEYSIKANANQVPATPVFSSLDQPVQGFYPAPVGRSVSVGEEPNGTFANERVSGIAFCTTANISGGGTFTSDVLEIGSFQQVQTHILSSHDGTLDIKFYNDEAKTDLVRNLVLPYYAINGFELFSAPSFSNYVTYSFTNTTGTTTTDFLYETRLLTGSLSGQVLGMNAPIASQMVANLGRNVIVSRQPNGNFKNEPHNGVAFSTDTPLISGGTYTTDWIDTDGYNSIELFFKTDELSDVGGIIVEFTDDLASPSTQETLVYTYTQTNIDRGHLDLFIPPRLVGFRLSYTNGATTQGSLLIQCDLKTNGVTNLYNTGGALVVGDFATEVSLKNVPNYGNDEGTGHVRLVDNGEAVSTIWNYADDDLTGKVARKTFKETAAAIWIASDNASDTSKDITMVYNDSANLYKEVTVTLNGTTPVDTGVIGFDVHSAFLSSADSTLVGNVFIQQGNGFTSGVPDDGADVLGYINPAYARTHHAVLRVPSDTRAVINSVYLTLLRAAGNAGSAVVFLRIKPTGGSWQIVRPFYLTNQTSIDKTEEIVLEPGTCCEFYVDDISDNETSISCQFKYTLVEI